jgi:two-component system, OmpR family, sensor kinase
MRRWTSLPIRVRLTILFAVGSAIVLAATGVFVYARSGADLLDATDAGLRSRADILAAEIRADGVPALNGGASLIERDEAFAQIADPSGAIIRSSTIVGNSPLLPAETIRALTGPQFFDQRIPGIDNVTRVLAFPMDGPDGTVTVIVGASLQDRQDQLLQLAATLAIGGPIALALISWAGWLLAGATLRPVQRMQREAATISSTDLDRRLTPPPAGDEVSQLAATLNAMLDRIQASFERERRFVDDASHELRTPIAILKAELDLATARARTPEELESALRSASEEAEHLARLAEDLLVLSRANGGKLSVHRARTSLLALLEEAADHFAARAAKTGQRIAVSAPADEVEIDPLRLRQAVDDLLDNAIRHAPPGGTIEVSGAVDGPVVRVSVGDSGRGFAPGFLPHAFEPFARRDARRNGGAGLGLAIVRAIAQAHGGTVAAANRPNGGAVVTMTLAAAELSP